MNEFWAAIAGAIMGATVGGFISFGLQMQALSAARVQREKDMLDAQKTLARSFVIKLSKLYSHLAQLDHRMKTLFADIAAKPMPKPELWASVQPLVPLPDLIHFTNDELTLLLTLKLDDLFNGVVMLDEAHNSVIGLLDIFNRRKIELNNSLVPDEFSDMTAHIILTQEQLNSARPGMLEVNQLVEALRENVDRSAAESLSLLNRIVTAFNEKLELKLAVSAKLATTGI